MRASSYIDLPQQIKRKQACVNIKSLDNHCFKWAILSALHPVNRRDNNYRISKYKKYESELNFTGIDCPVALKDLAKFELRMRLLQYATTTQAQENQNGRRYSRNVK